MTLNIIFNAALKTKFSQKKDQTHGCVPLWETSQITLILQSLSWNSHEITKTWRATLLTKNVSKLAIKLIVRDTHHLVNERWSPLYIIEYVDSKFSCTCILSIINCVYFVKISSSMPSSKFKINFDFHQLQLCDHWAFPKFVQIWILFFPKNLTTKLTFTYKRRLLINDLVRWIALDIKGDLKVPSPLE